MSESSLYKNRMSTEYVCVDNEWEHYGTTNNDNAVWYFTKGMCGSLPCPPYINGKLLTCVVCSR